MNSRYFSLRMMIHVIFILIISSLLAACSSGEQQEASGDQPAVFQESEEGQSEEDETHQDEEAEHEEESEHDEGERREFGAHEHGAATLTIAWSGNEGQMELDTPAFNLFGFEYEPATEEDIQLVQESIGDLESGRLFQLNEEADCRVVDVLTETAWEEVAAHEAEEEGERESEHEAEGEDEAHSDVVARFNLICESPEDLRTMDFTTFFERFPNFEELEAQWVSDAEQSSAELTADAPVLRFR